MTTLRRALRLYRRQPLATAVVISTLALGIGVTTAIFSIVYGILWSPLAYPEADRLVRVFQTYETLRESTNPRLQRIWNRLPLSYLNARDYRESSRTVAHLGLASEYSVTVTGQGEPLQVDAAGVDAGLLAALAVPPAAGRWPTAEEVERRERRVLLSHELWQKLYGGDAGAVGRKLLVDGEPHSVTGVMPAGFRVTRDRTDRLWTPLRLEDDDQRRDNQRLWSIARLADGATLSAARTELEQLAASHATTYPESNEGVGVRLALLQETIVGESRPILKLLLAAVAVVLLVACVNVAHLLLAQAGSRHRELAIRLALGAGRRRLVGQLLTESLLLAVSGGTLGVLLATEGQRLMLAWIPSDLPRMEAVTVDGAVLLFALVLSLVAAVGCGLLPALMASSAAAGHSLRGASGDVPRARRPLSAHGGLVVGEIALTLMLASIAALLVNSFLRLSAVDPGFEDEGVLVQQVELPEWRYADAGSQHGFAGRLVDRVAGLPGVRSAGLTTKLPFAGLALVAGFRLPEDSADQDWITGRSASLKFVTPDYFETLDIAVLEGRGFTDRDLPESGRVLVVNETLARKTWPAGSPVGRPLLMGSDPEPYTVVGVVADIRHDGLEKDPGVLMYQPWSQLAGGPMSRRLIIVARVDGDPGALAEPVRRVVRELDPALPLPAAATLTDLLVESLGTPRARTSLVSALAILALVLALVGTYAVMSFIVGCRRRELGIRMALGADASRVRSLVLRRTLQLTAAGVGLGVVGTFYGARLLEGLLYGIDGTDPWTLSVAALLLVAASLLAGYLPARRASRIDPVVALRED